MYAAGGYYYPDGGSRSAAREMRGYLDLGYDAVKMKIGGAALDEDLARIEAVVDIVGDAGRVAVDANGRFDRDEATRWGGRAGPLRPALVRRAGRSARLRAEPRGDRLL